MEYDDKESSCCDCFLARMIVGIGLFLCFSFVAEILRVFCQSIRTLTKPMGFSRWWHPFCGVCACVYAFTNKEGVSPGKTVLNQLLYTEPGQGCFYYSGQKKRTILEIRLEKNAVPRVISCLIRRDQRRVKVADSRGSRLPCADRAWSSMISHVEQRSSRCESRWWFFFCPE